MENQESLNGIELIGSLALNSGEDFNSMPAGLQAWIEISEELNRLEIENVKVYIYRFIKVPGKKLQQTYVDALDFVPDEDLLSLYKHALAFVLPSLYEGFGLPVLEAIAQGCPAVVSKTSSLPEIAGKAGIYIDPLNTESIA